MNLWLVSLFRFKRFKHCFTFRLQNVSALITLQTVNSVRTKDVRILDVQGINLTVVGIPEQMNTYYMKKVLFLFIFYYTWHYQEMRVGMPLTGLTPPYLLCLCQVRTYISNTLWHGHLYVQCFELRGNCSFCWQ